MAHVIIPSEMPKDVRDKIAFKCCEPGKTPAADIYALVVASGQPLVAPETSGPRPCPFCGAVMKRSNWNTKLWVGHKPGCFMTGHHLFDNDMDAWNARALQTTIQDGRNGSHG